MKLGSPSAPFERLDIRGESITIDVDATNLVIPTGNDTLPMFNEKMLDPMRINTNFGGYSEESSDYCPGTVSVLAGNNIYLTDVAGNNKSKSISAGKLKENGYLTVDHVAHTITEEFIIKNYSICNHSYIVDSCESTSGWQASGGSGHTFALDSTDVCDGVASIKCLGVSDTSGNFGIKKYISYTNTHRFLSICIKSTVGTNVSIRLYDAAAAHYITYSHPLTHTWQTLTIPLYSQVSYPIGFNPNYIYSVIIQITGIAHSSSADIHVDIISMDDGTVSDVEIQTPDLLDKTTSLVIQAHNGSSYQTCGSYVLEDEYTQVALNSASWVFTDNNSFDGSFGQGLGRALFPKGLPGSTVIGSTGSLTYSTNGGTQSRIGIRITLPTNKDVRLKLILSYAPDSQGNYVTTYNFNNSNNTSYGLQNAKYPWIALLNNNSNYVDFFVPTTRFKQFTIEKNDNGHISKLTLYPGNGTILHGNIHYSNLAQDSDSNLIPNWLTLSHTGNIIKFLKCYDTNNPPINIYIVPPMSNTRILPTSTLPDYLLGDEISINASPGESTCASFVVSTTGNLTVDVDISDFSSGNDIISKSIIDIAVVKCVYEGNHRSALAATERCLVPKFLLHDDSIILVDGEKWGKWDVSNPDGKNYLNINGGTYIDISNSDPQYTSPNVISTNDRYFVDADTLQQVNLHPSENKQFWITIAVPDSAIPGIHTGYIQLTFDNHINKFIKFNLNVLNISLPTPLLEYSLYYRGIITANGSISSEQKTIEQFTADQENLVRHGVTCPNLHIAPSSNSVLAQELQIRQDCGISNTNLYYGGLNIGSTTQQITDVLSVCNSYGVQNLYIYGYDEQNLDADRTEISNAHTAGAKIFCSQSVANAATVPDVLDLAIVAGPPDKSLAATYHTNGHKIYSYANPQAVSGFPLEFRVNYGFLLWQNDYDGVMNYAYQHSFGDMWNDFDDDSFRDHAFAYPTSNGAINTLIFEGLREAVNDIKYLTALINTISSAPNPSDPVVIDATNFVDTLKSANLVYYDLDEIRSQMIDYILAIQNEDVLVSISGGSNSGYYHEGDTVLISANDIPGTSFTGWVGDVEYLSTPTNKDSLLTVPSTNIEFIANYTVNWYNYNYNYCKNIIINHKQVSNVDLYNFPFYFSITDETLKYIENGGHVSNQNCYDVIFVSDGAELDYEIEQYDPQTGHITVWIKIPLLSHTQDTLITMYYGNPTITSTQENIHDVWDDNYLGVWHLATQGTYLDSTSNSNNGSSDSYPTLSNGVQVFNGSTNYISIPIINSDTSFTVQIKFKPNSITSTVYLISQLYAGAPNNKKGWGIWQYPGIVTFDVADKTQNTHGVNGAPISTDDWYNVTLCYDKEHGTVTSYANGVKLGMDLTLDGYTQFLHSIDVGRLSYSNSNYFEGMIDEIKFSKCRRSSDWIKTENLNQLESSIFYRVGSENSVDAI